MKRKALFIINPVSGGKKKDEVPGMIKKYLDKSIEPTVVFTNRVLHASELAKDAIDKYDLVVAVGGDGTVNEIGSAIVGTETILGIIPCGSGNGLARFLSVPMNMQKAMKTLGNWRVEKIDSGKLNEQWFFNMAGMGFDAHISEVFSHDKTRGFGAYIKSAFQEIIRYDAEQYHIEIDGKIYEREAFMLSFANSSQYGNNAHVSPKASVKDGLIDVCIIKPFPLYRFPEMGLRMFTKSANRSKFVEIIRGKNIKVTRDNKGPVHLDGEPQVIGAHADITVVPDSLKIITGKSFKSN